VVISQPEVPGTRFKLLQIIKQFARKKIPEHLSSVISAKHAEFFVHWTVKIGPMLRGANREEYLSQVEREYSNLCAVLEWSRSDLSGLHSGMRIAGAIWPYWLHRGRIREGLNWLQAFLAQDQEDAPAQFKAPALIGAGVLVLFGDESATTIHKSQTTLESELF
jgi:predicted ATPase